MSVPVTSEVALLIDSGSAWTKASVVAKVRGRWRLTAHAAQPTGWAWREMRRALTDQLAGLVDPRLTNDVDDLVRQANRIECRTPPHASRLALVAVSRELSGAAARRAAEAAGWEVVDAVTLDDGRSLPERLDRLAELRPDAWLLAGGFDDAESERAVEAATLVAATRRPGDTPLLWAGSTRLARRVDGLFPDDELVRMPNPRPDARTERLGPLRARLEQLLRAPAEAEAADARPQLAQLAFRRSVTALARGAGLRVLGVDIGSRYATRVLAGPGRDAESQVYASGGLAGVALVAGSAGRVARLLAQPIDELVVADVLQTLRAHPATMPHTIGELLVTQAAARFQLALMAAVDPVSGIDLLVGAGRTIAAAPTPGQAAQILIDGLRPLGVTQLALDAAGALTPLGALSEEEVPEGIELLADDLLVPLGTVVVCRGGQPGRVAMRVSMHRPGWPDHAPVEVRTGGLQIVPLAAGQQAELIIEPAEGVSLGAPRRSSRIHAAAVGGSVGLILDARGIPMAIPRRSDDRRAVLGGWAEAFQREPMLPAVLAR